MNNLYYIQDKKRRTIKFKFNSVQEDVWKTRTSRDVYLKSRQITMTTFWVLYFLDECLFKNNIEARTIADTEDNLPKIFKKAKFAYQHLPETLKKLYPLHSNSKYEMSFGNRNSCYQVCLETHSDTVSMLHFSEVAFMRGDVSRKIVESTQTVPMDMENTQIVFESIADGVANEFHGIYVNGKKEFSAYTSHFYEWFKLEEYTLDVTEDYEKEILENLDEDESKLIEKHNLSIGQIAWRREKIRELNGDKELFLVKYPENDTDCFLSTGKNVFDSHIINDMLNDDFRQLKVVKRFKFGTLGVLIEDEKGYIECFEDWKPDANDEYVLGGDISKGISGGDSSCLFIVSKKTYMPRMRFKANTNPELVGMYAVYMCKIYGMPAPIIAIEKNDRGYTAIIKAVKMGYKNIYYNGMERDASFREYGFDTNKKTKPIMIDQLAYDMKIGCFDKLPFSLLLEMSTYIQNDDGSFGAATGEHDDEIIAFAIALQMCYYFPYKFKRKIKKSKSLDYVSDLKSNNISVINKKGNKKKNEYANIIT